MKIKYIKDAPNGPAGSLDEVTEFEGNILVLTGYAEIDEDIEPTEPKPKTKSKAKSKTIITESATVTDDGTKTESDSE